MFQALWVVVPAVFADLLTCVEHILWKILKACLFFHRGILECCSVFLSCFMFLYQIVYCGFEISPPIPSDSTLIQRYPIWYFASKAPDISLRASSKAYESVAMFKERAGGSLFGRIFVCRLHIYENNYRQRLFPELEQWYTAYVLWHSFKIETRSTLWSHFFLLLGNFLGMNTYENTVQNNLGPPSTYLLF